MTVAFSRAVLGRLMRCSADVVGGFEFDQLLECDADRFTDQVDAITGVECLEDLGRADWGKTIGGYLIFGEFFAVHTEDPAASPQTPPLPGTLAGVVWASRRNRRCIPGVAAGACLLSALHDASSEGRRGEQVELAPSVAESRAASVQIDVDSHHACKLLVRAAAAASAIAAGRM